MKTRKPFCGYDIADGDLCRETKLNDKGHCVLHAPEYEPQHTPTPWDVEEDGRGRSISSSNSLVAKTFIKEDAAFIVLAVNAHEELLACLKAATLRLKEFGPVQRNKKWYGVDLTSDLDQAIAKATESK